jgi:hypothetical protein
MNTGVAPRFGERGRCLRTERSLAWRRASANGAGDREEREEQIEAASVAPRFGERGELDARRHERREGRILTMNLDC